MAIPVGKDMPISEGGVSPDGEVGSSQTLSSTVHGFRNPVLQDQSHTINIPKPQLYPVQGVSQDPKFYEKAGQNTNNNYYNRLWYRESGTMRYPHGSMYGYSTDVGIVPVPDDPVHGHVWKDGQWTLQAQVDDGVPASRGSWSPPRRRGRPSG